MHVTGFWREKSRTGVIRLFYIPIGRWWFSFERWEYSRRSCIDFLLRRLCDIAEKNPALHCGPISKKVKSSADLLTHYFPALTSHTPLAWVIIGWSDCLPTSDCSELLLWFLVLRHSTKNVLNFNCHALLFSLQEFSFHRGLRFFLAWLFEQSNRPQSKQNNRSSSRTRRIRYVIY